MTVDNRQERPILGASFLLIGICSVALMDALAKILSADIAVYQVTWARFFFHFLSVTPFALYLLHHQRKSGAQSIIALGDRRKAWFLHILRGFLLAISSFAFFFAIRDNPVPDSIAVFFVEPLIVMFMARIFLGEPLNRRLLIAAFCGLLGVLIILRPGGDSGYHWSIVFALVAAFSFAGYIVTARFASLSTPAVITSWLTAAFGLLPTLPVLFAWAAVDARQLSFMVAIGVLSGFGHTFIILACRYLIAARVAILHYVEVGIATIISWWLFSHIPGWSMWLGVIIIACANIYALRRN